MAHDHGVHEPEGRAPENVSPKVISMINHTFFTADRKGYNDSRIDANGLGAPYRPTAAPAQPDDRARRRVLHR